MKAFEDRHREDSMAAAEREERAEALALAREAEYERNTLQPLPALPLSWRVTEVQPHNP
jgi:hypothetical protein